MVGRSGIRDCSRIEIQEPPKAGGLSPVNFSDTASSVSVSYLIISEEENDVGPLASRKLVGKRFRPVDRLHLLG